MNQMVCFGTIKNHFPDFFTLRKRLLQVPRGIRPKNSDKVIFSQKFFTEDLKTSSTVNFDQKIRNKNFQNFFDFLAWYPLCDFFTQRGYQAEKSKNFKKNFFSFFDLNRYQSTLGITWKKIFSKKTTVSLFFGLIQRGTYSNRYRKLKNSAKCFFMVPKHTIWFTRPITLVFYRFYSH